MEATITAEQVREAINYDPLTGAFTWRHRDGVSARWNGRYPGTAAGTAICGYIIIRIYKRHYRAQRLAWLYVYGEWPSGLVDHINGDRGDNRIENLRVATVSQNQMNSRHRSNNTSGIKGVTWNKQRGKWMAQIGAGRHLYLGLHETKEEAAAAYAAAAEQYHGDFRRLA